MYFTTYGKPSPAGGDAVSDDREIQTLGPNGYGRCPRQYLRSTEVSVEARWLWTCLEDYASPDSPQPFPGQDTLAEFAGKSVRTIQRWEKELVEAQWLVVTLRGLGRTSLYTLVWPGFQHLIPDLTSASGPDTTPVSGPDTTPVSGEAEPVEAEPVEATTPPTPQGSPVAKWPTTAELFEWWWRKGYGLKLGSKSRAKKRYAALLRSGKTPAEITVATENYLAALDLFEAVAKARTGLDGIRPAGLHGTTLLNQLDDFEEPLTEDEVSSRWAAVLWEHERSNGRSRPPSLSVRELARQADQAGAA